MNEILIWGTGNIAAQIMKNGINGKIAGFVETHKTKDYFEGYQVYSIDDVPHTYDYMIVANSYSDLIYEICVEKQLDLEKIIFLQSIKKRVGNTELEVVSQILGEKNFTNYCSEFGLIEESFYKHDMEAYQKLNTRSNFAINNQYNWPVINEKYALAGSIDNYFWQDLWAARHVCASGAEEHFDIGSRIDGFIAHILASGIKVLMIDIREFPDKVENLHTIADDATSLRQIEDESISSMSALCSLEHFGLGRYGDPIDPEACFRCFSNIQKKIKKGGKLYISLPIGKERVEFNAHRVFYAKTVIENFSELELKEFTCTADGKIEYHVPVDKYDNDLHNGNYRYGLFYFERV